MYLLHYQVSYLQVYSSFLRILSSINITIPLAITLNTMKSELFGTSDLSR